MILRIRHYGSVQDVDLGPGVGRISAAGFHVRGGPLDEQETPRQHATRVKREKEQQSRREERDLVEHPRA